MFGHTFCLGQDAKWRLVMCGKWKRKDMFVSKIASCPSLVNANSYYKKSFGHAPK